MLSVKFHIPTLILSALMSYLFFTFSSFLGYQNCAFVMQGTTKQATIQNGFQKDIFPEADDKFLSGEPPFFADLVHVRVSAMLLYSRFEMSSITVPFIARELRINSGIIDRMYIMVCSEDKTISRGFDNLVSRYPDIVQIVHIQNNPEKLPRQRLFLTAWKRFHELNLQAGGVDVAMKFDDDTVWIRRGAPGYIAREVLRKRCSVVSANVINHPALSQFHQRNSAIMHFRPCPGEATKPWCFHDGLSSPAYRYDGDPWGTTLTNYEYAVNMHESFFRHVEENTLAAYNVGLHDFHVMDYTRWSINMIGMTQEVLNVYYSSQAPLDELGDDEVMLSVTIPRQLNKHACSVGEALIAHFSYGAQRAGQLDNAPHVLPRYEALAQAVATDLRCGVNCTQAALSSWRWKP